MHGGRPDAALNLSDTQAMTPSRWDRITAWLGQHQGRRVSISLTASGVESDGNACASLSSNGLLRTDDRVEIVAVDPPPGRHLSGRVGSSFFVLFEGAIEAVDFERGSLYVSTKAGDLAFTPS